MFVRESDSLYWLIDNGVKRRIPASLMGSSGYMVSQQTPITLPASVLSQYPMSTLPLGRVLRATNGKGVYLIENGKKRVFASEQALFGYGFIWNDVQVVSPFVISNIQDGQPIY